MCDVKLRHIRFGNSWDTEIKTSGAASTFFLQTLKALKVLSLQNQFLCLQNSFLMSMQRHLRRGGPTSPANQLLSPQGAVLNKSSTQLLFGSAQEQDFLRLVDSFVRNVLR